MYGACGDTPTLTGLGGDPFDVDHSYSITPQGAWDGNWNVGDAYQLWRWRCKTPTDSGNPEPDCLQVMVRELSKPGGAQMLLGISHYNLQNIKSARRSFRKAVSHEETEKQAKLWL